MRTRNPPPLSHPAKEGHLGHDAPDGPEVDGGGVEAVAKQQLRRPIPEGNDGDGQPAPPLMVAREGKVAQANPAALVKQNVRRL